MPILKNYWAIVWPYLEYASASCDPYMLVDNQMKRCSTSQVLCIHAIHSLTLPWLKCDIWSKRRQLLYPYILHPCTIPPPGPCTPLLTPLLNCIITLCYSHILQTIQQYHLQMNYRIRPLDFWLWNLSRWLTMTRKIVGSVFFNKCAYFFL